MKNEEKSPAQGRLVPAPDFVDARWVEVQIGLPAIQKIPEISAGLAKKYDHWEALAKKYERWRNKAPSEQDKAEFCGQIARELARPGFLHHVINAVLLDPGTSSPPSGKSSKKKKTYRPFDFIIERFVWANPKSKTNKKHHLSTDNPQFFHDSLHSAITKWKEGDEKYFEPARDFLFFLPLLLVDAPLKKTAEMIQGTELQPVFEDFFIDFEAAVKEYKGVKSSESIEDANKKWRETIDQFAADIKKFSEAVPSMEAVTDANIKFVEHVKHMEDAAKDYEMLLKHIEKDKAQWAARDLAEKLEPYKEYSQIPDIPALYKHLSGLGETGTPFDAERYAAVVSKLAEKLPRHQELTGGKTADASAENPEAEQLKGEISEIALELMPELKKKREKEERIRKEKQERAAQKEARLKKEQEIAAQKDAAKKLKEQEQARQAEEERIRQEKEARKQAYADRINALAADLVAIEEFQLAYHVACCGEAGAKEGQTDPSMLGFPSHALRYLAFPDLTGKGEEVGAALNADLGVHSHDENVSQSRKILIFAAGLFPALFHLPSNVRTLYGLRIDNCGGKLDGIVGAIQDLEGREISVEEFNESGKADPAAEPIRFLKDWHESKKQITLKYAPATRGWEKWMHEEGLLGSVILPLCANPDGGLERAAEFAAEIDRDTDKHVDAICPRKVVGPVRMQIQENLREAASLIQNVVSALQSEERSPGGETHQKCVAFRNALADAGKDGFVPGGQHSAALTACIRRAISFLAEDAVEGIFLGEPIKEIPGLAKITGALHNSDGDPAGHSDALVDQIADALAKGWLTEKADDACERQIRQRALLSARLIESRSDLSVVRRRELEKIIKETTLKLREQLEKRKADVERMLDDPRIPANIRAESRQNLDLVIPQNIPASDSENTDVPDFPHAFEIVEATGQSMNQALQESGAPRG